MSCETSLWLQARVGIVFLMGELIPYVKHKHQRYCVLWGWVGPRLACSDSG